MSIHAIDTVDLSWGLACWHCTCGKSFYSQRGFDRHLAIETHRYPAPWPGAYWRRLKEGLR